MSNTIQLPQFSFADCHNITDIIVLLSEIQQLDTSITTSRGESRSAELLMQDVLIGVGVAATIDRTATDLDTQLDNALRYITEGQGDLHLRSTIKKLLTTAVHDHKGIFVPWEIAGQMTNDPACARLRLRIDRQVGDQFSLKSIGQQPVSFKEATSLNELFALVHQAKTIQTTEGRPMPAQEVVRRLQGLIDRDPNRRQWPVILHAEIPKQALILSGRGQMISPRLLSYIMPNEAGRESDRLAPQTEFLHHPPQPAAKAAREPARPAIVKPSAERQPRQSTFFGLPTRQAILAGAAAFTVGGTAAAVPIGVVLYKYLTHGHHDEATDTGVAIPEGWVECSPEQFAEIDAIRKSVKEHELRFAEHLVRHAKTGLSRDGAINTDSHDRVASLAVANEDLDNLFNLHKHPDVRILCYSEAPTIVSTDGKGEIDLPTVALMHHADTPDNLSDDVMGFNTYWLDRNQPPPLMSAPWHEMGHKYQGGKGHSATIADLDRDSRTFSLAILAEGDFPYYISLNIDTASTIANNYLQTIDDDIAGLRNSKPLTDAELDRMHETYRVTAGERKQWASAMAKDYFNRSDVLDPLGVTPTTVSEALLVGHMDERANEMIDGYFQELRMEIAREQNRELHEQQHNELRPLPRERSWK